MAYSAQEVSAFIAANPQLSAEELRRLAQENGVSPAILSQASGGAISDQAAPQPNYTKGQITDEQVRTLLQNDPGASDRKIARIIDDYEIDPMVLARASGTEYGVIVDRLAAARAENASTGLTGFEDSINAGLTSATNTVRGAESGARGDINSGLDRINKLYGVNIDDLRQAGTAAQDTIGEGFGRAEDYFTPFREGGTQAFNQQLALSGAMGKDAFDAANNESPYTAFLREQGMRSNLAGAAATGGLGGGNVQKELQRFGQGLASQGLQQQFNNLGALSSVGFNGAQGAAGVATGGAAAQAEIGINTANNIASQRGAQAGFAGQAAAGLANIGMQAGNNIAGMQFGTGQDIASQRARAGELLAQQYQNVTSNQAGLISGQGDYLSGLTGNAYTNVINTNNAAANNAAANQIGLANNVSGLQTGFVDNAGSMITNQPIQQANLPSYQNQIAGVVGAAGDGYQLGQMYNGQQSPAPVGSSVPSYTSPNFVGSGQYVSPPRSTTGQLQVAPTMNTSSQLGGNYYGNMYG